MPDKKSDTPPNKWEELRKLAKGLVDVGLEIAADEVKKYIDGLSPSGGGPTKTLKEE